MIRSNLLQRAPDGAILPLVGLEADNLLGFLALLGLLRALEASMPHWHPRASWVGPPWTARLHVVTRADSPSIAMAARGGMTAILKHYDVDGRANVDFTDGEFRAFLERRHEHDEDTLGTSLATALATEYPVRRSGGVRTASPGPLVMMFGQGHQNFLDRLVSVPAGDLPNKLKKAKTPPKLDHPRHLEQALFQPWLRADQTDGFRWDAEEDQRYALRATNPSDEGAAPTVHGANQLAAIGLLSYTSFPGQRHQRTRGVTRSAEGFSFVWPIWSEALELYVIEDFLAHDKVLDGRLEEIRGLGVVEIFRARRIANGKFVNVARAFPVPSRQIDRRQ